jgi:hypothetical protein
MTDANEVDALRQRHAVLDRQLEEEQARPMPDNGILVDLKRQKLAIKDQISNFEGASVA